MILLAAGLLYIFCLRCYYLGYFIDDAAYLAGAQALLQGRYDALFLIGRPPLVDYFPGFPSFLIPVYLVAHALGDQWILIQIFMIGVMLLNVALLWRLTQGWFSSYGRRIAVGLFALHPLVASLSGAVMAESAFLALFLLVLLGFREAADATLPSFAIGAFAGWAALTRPQGLAVPVGLTAAALLSRRFRQAAVLAATAGMVVAPFYIRYGFGHDAPVGYLDQILRIKGSLSWSGFLSSNFWEQLRAACADSFWAWSSRHLFWRQGVALVLVLGALAALGRGVWRSRGLWSEPWFKGMILCTALAAGTQVFWVATQARYVLPLLPFLIAFFVKGVLPDRPRHDGLRMGIVLVALAVRFLYVDAFVVRRSMRPPFVLPERTFLSIRNHIRPEEVVASNAIPTIFLYTGRPGRTLGWARDPNEFYDMLRRWKVAYVHVDALTPLQPSNPSLTGPHETVARARQWVQDRRRYRLVFESPYERQRIYRVLSSPAPPSR